MSCRASKKVIFRTIKKLVGCRLQQSGETLLTLQQHQHLQVCFLAHPDRIVFSSTEKQQKAPRTIIWWKMSATSTFVFFSFFVSLQKMVRDNFQTQSCDNSPVRLANFNLTFCSEPAWIVKFCAKWRRAGQVGCPIL